MDSQSTNPTPSSEQPVAPQPATTTYEPTPAVAQPVAAAVAPVQAGSKALSIWALILAILAFISGPLFFISGPLALVAVILAIVVLAKHKPGKGQSIAAVIIGGVALLAVPFWGLVTLTAYNNLTERAKDAQSGSGTVQIIEQ